MPNVQSAHDSLQSLRLEIDRTDEQLLDLFLQRMDLASRVASCKLHDSAPVSVPGREQEIFDRIHAKVPVGFASDAERLFRTILAVSCARQRLLILSSILARTGQRIVLCGIKHCGKTVLGQRLASLFGLPFDDTDAVIEAAAGKSVRALYGEVGEEAFRRIEADTVRKFSESAPKKGVVALGGGVVANPFLSKDDLAGLGLLVWLDVPVQTAFERITREGLPPFLSDMVDPRAEFERICIERAELYQTHADVTVSLPESGPEDDAVDLILTAIEQKVNRP